MSIKVLVLEDRKTFLDAMVEVMQLTCPKAEISSHLTVDTAWKAFQATPHWNRIVVDLMMPSGELFSPAETSSGLDTGQAFVELVIRQSETSFDQIVVHSARNQGLWDSIEHHPKVVELPKAEKNHVALADFLFKDFTIE